MPFNFNVKEVTLEELNRNISTDSFIVKVSHSMKDSCCFLLINKKKFWMKKIFFEKKYDAKAVFTESKKYKNMFKYIKGK